MRIEQKWELACEAAALLVESYRRELPDGVEVYAADLTLGSGEGATDFRRKGDTTKTRTYSLPSAIESLVRGAPLTSAVDATSGGAESNALLTLLQQASTDLPSLITLQEAEGIDPQVFTGLTSLTGMTNRNPYSTDYETAIGDLYDRQFARARSLAQSGPANVRGGTARQGFELGEIESQIGQNKFRDIRQQQDREAGVVQNAVNILNTIENMRRGTRLHAQQQHTAGEATRTGQTLGASDSLSRRRAAHQNELQMAGEFLGVPTGKTEDDLSGKGFQTTDTTQWGTGFNCCFIFLEVLNGKLPEYVRRGRDEYNTPNRRGGYVWMSQWLVPLMQKHGWVKKVVNNIMVRPFIKWGGWLYDGKKEGRWLKPYCWCWFWLWSMLGVIYGKEQKFVGTVKRAGGRDGEGEGEGVEEAVEKPGSV